MAEKIKVLIVEDSLLYQSFIRSALSRESDMEVQGCASTGQQAMRRIESDPPDVVTLDLHLPDVMDFELLDWLTHHSHAAVLVVTGDPKDCQKAISMGAGDFLIKAQGGTSRDLEQFSLLLALKVRFLARGEKQACMAAAEQVSALPNLKDDRLIVLGASLGGTEATLQVLQELPVDMPGIVVVQHMPEGFTGAYAMRLNRCCAMEVREARNGDAVRPGLVLIARGGEKLTVLRGSRGYLVRCAKPMQPNPQGFCPSVDDLFRSAAEAAGARAAGVLLTGMGRDGAEGLLKMRRAGAATYGQDEASCVVYGMPGAARKIGAVETELPLDEIAGALKKRFLCREE